MNNHLISVIVPVYNVERYLPRCIESILKQSYTNFELILIDDGTPDRSGMICDRYAEKDSRIRVVHKENGGVSSARNAGIDVAKGDWITFIDSDDWVSNSFLESFFQDTIEDFDLLIGSCKIVRSRVQHYINRDGEINIYECLDGAIKALENFMFDVPWGKMFKRDLILDNKLNFPVGIKWGEDSHFVAEYLALCKKMRFVSGAVYNYNCLNQSSITNKQIWTKEKIVWDLSYIEKHQKLLEIYGADDKTIKSIISKKALTACALDIRTVVVNAETLQDAEHDIMHVIGAFEGWIFKDKEWIFEQGNERYRYRYELIEKKDVRTLFESFQIKKIKKCDQLKLKLKKILNPLIEKYRDGLIKFKF